MKLSLSELSDQLSPVLVKDLRHGLRTRSFIAFFLILQALLILTVFGDLGQAMDASARRGRSGAEEIFWFFIGAALLYFLPIRGFGAISSEIKSNTLELIFLSRLTAWRIITGKWASLMAQTFLFVCAVLPYMLLRYFVGGINLIEDLQRLLIMFIASACLTSFTVAVSAFNSKVAAAFFSFSGIIFAATFGVYVSTLGRRSGTSVGFEFYMIFFSLGILFLITMMLVGASKIAPQAENFSRWKRIMALLTLAISVCFIFFNIAVELSLAAACFLTFFICFFALGEEPRYLVSVCKPFVRYGWCGRLAGRFFYPGWPSGVRFTFVVTALLLCALAFSVKLNEQALVFTLALFASLLGPLAIVKLIPLNAEGTQRIGYFPLQIGLIAASYGLFVLTEIFNLGRGLVNVILPHASLAQIIFDRRGYNADTALVAFAFLSAVSLVILIAKMIPIDRKIKEVERAAADELRLEKQIAGSHVPPLPSE